MTVNDPSDWLRRVDSDIDTVKRYLGGAYPNIDSACLHVQQAAEKLIKALLVYAEVRFPRGKEGHDIGICADKLPDDHPCKQMAHDFEFATDWKAPYPSDDPMAEDPFPEVDEVIVALEKLEAFRAAALVHLGFEVTRVPDPLSEDAICTCPNNCPVHGESGGGGISPGF